MADLAFWVKDYNDILSCLYTNKEVRVDPQDSTVSAEEGEGGWDMTNVTALFSHEEAEVELAEVSLWVA